MSLLEKTKSAPILQGRSKDIPSSDSIELAIAYAKGEITLRQANFALGNKNNASTEHVLNVALRYAVASGVLS